MRMTQNKKKIIECLNTCTCPCTAQTISKIYFNFETKENKKCNSETTSVLRKVIL